MKKRNISLDILRSVATIAVVVFHVLSSSTNNDPMVSANVHSNVTAITNMLQWHVPVFFMITGYLWLQDEKECTFKKMIPNIRRFVCVLFTIGFSYAVMERFFDIRSISVSLFLKSITDVLTGNLWDHMWFLYSIIGVYLILPILKKFYANSTECEIKYFVALLFVFSILAPLIYEITDYKIPIELPASSSLFYVCVGGLITKKKQNRNVAFSICGFCLCSVATFLLTIFVEEGTVFIPLLNCISAVSLFLAVLSMASSNEEPKLIRSFSNCTFGIYLFHPFYINVMLKLLHIYPLQYSHLIALTIACIVIIGLSFATTYMLRCIPFIKKFIL